MATKTTLDELGEMLAHVVKHMATKDDVVQLATKDQIIALHTQVNGIEADIRAMKADRLVTRVADLEEDIFGEARR